jgi:hypothetical protein
MRCIDLYHKTLTKVASLITKIVIFIECSDYLTCYNFIIHKKEPQILIVVLKKAQIKGLWFQEHLFPRSTDEYQKFAR